MHPDCVLEIAQAIGRAPTKAELDAFEGGLLSTMRELARSEPAKWQTLSAPQRMQAAAEMAHARAIEDADKAADRRASTLLTQSREAQRLLQRAQAKGGTKAHHRALFERLRQVDDYVAGVRNEALGSLVDAIHAVEPRFFGLMDDPASIRSFVYAIYGNAETPEMAKAAKAYTDTVEELRVRSNANGTDIGKLDYNYLPPSHDTGRIARAGKEKWVADNRSRYDRTRNIKADGSIMDDAEWDEFLGAAWETLATEGRNQRVPGAARGGSRASRFDEKHRVLHFKDADSHLAYLADYGRGSLLQAIHGHVSHMAKSIGLMEELGANPTSTYRLLKDLAEQRDNAQGVSESFATADMVWDTLNGTTAQPVNAKLAQFFQGVRNFTTAAKLQGVMLSAVTDAPLQVIVARSAGVPMGEALHSLVRGVGGDSKALAHELALGMDEIAGEMARWHQDHLAQGWTAKLANTTMKLTLVEAWTNALRRGYGLTLSAALERQRHTAWADIDQHGRNRLEAAGVTEADWQLWQRAEAKVDGPSKFLSAEGIRALDAPEADKNRAVARLLGYLDQEARTAVLAPDLMTRAMIQQGTKAGTWGGEALRSLMLFKSFAFGIVDKHLRRIRDIPTTQGRVAYSAAMMTSLTLFGAVAVQLKDMVQGKDPRDMSDPKFWSAAFLQGGGMGVFGDVLYTGMGGNSRGGQANWTSLAGPVFGNVMDFFDLTLGNLGRAATADNSTERDKVVDKAQADAVRFARSNAPLINLWYLRATVDHLLLHDMQESLAPGYLRRMKERARKDWGQRYWWEPGESAPERAPDMAAAVGE